MANQSSIEIALKKDSPARLVCARESIERRLSLGCRMSSRRKAGWIDLAGTLLRRRSVTEIFVLFITLSGNAARPRPGLLAGVHHGD